MTERISELARNLVMIDFDATILPWGPLMEHDRVPFPGVAEAMHELRANGYRIGIFTSRMSPAWIAYAGTSEDEQLGYIKKVLDEHDIPYDLITAEKLPAEAYFDDKAWNVPDGDLAEVLRDWRLYATT